MQIDLASFIITVLVGVACSFCGWMMMRRMKRAAAGTAECTGKVVEVVCEMILEGPAVYYPVIEFTTADGRVIRKKCPSGDSRRKYEEGDEAEVVYNLADPEEFTLKGSPAATFAVLFLFLGIILIAFACAKFF